MAQAVEIRNIRVDEIYALSEIDTSISPVECVGDVFQPLPLDPIVIWNDLTGSSKTATVEIASASTLTNAEVWLEVEYPLSASFPLGAVVTSRVTGVPSGSPGNVTSSAASWASSPGTTQKLQVPFTPQQKGPIKARVFVGKASQTLYVDPLITIT